MPQPLTEADRALIERATDTCQRAFDPAGFDGENAHVVASALRTEDGTVYDGVSLPTSVGRASVCAEPVSVGEAISDGVDRSAFDTVVAVAHPQPQYEYDEVVVIPPCGVCREMLVDYEPDLRVIVPEDEEGGPLTVARAGDLLPNRTW
jgi:cytidine deaminase